MSEQDEKIEDFRPTLQALKEELNAEQPSAVAEAEAALTDLLSGNRHGRSKVRHGYLLSRGNNR